VPSAPKVSVAVTHVVIPGRVESIAVSSVQSMKAPLGKRSRCVGRTDGRTAGVMVGASKVASALEGAALPPISSDGVSAPAGGDSGSGPEGALCTPIADAEPLGLVSNAGPESL